MEVRSFGLLYGMTTGSLKFRLNKTAEEADEITAKYWGTFPRVQPWLQETVHAMHKHHLVRYWSGRVWREDEPDNFYKGCNAQIQGGAADLIQLAIIRAQAVLRANGWGQIASIIHDEIMAEVKDEHIEQAIPVLIKIMELEDIFGLPFKAEAKVGKTYGKFEDYEVEQSRLDGVNWKAYLPPSTDLTKLTLVPWKQAYAAGGSNEQIGAVSSQTTA